MVLVAGGEVPSRDALSTAELYDPATGKWKETGQLKNPHSGHTATLLPNGKVLVAGGSDEGGATVSCELYEPSTGKWSLTGSLNAACICNSATLLPNGNVLLAGSFRNTSDSCSRVEIYDAKSGKWIQSRSLTTPRNCHTATALPDGRVLFVGGEVVNRWEIYDVSKK
jgi:N-acetylneuraminic acid mutarotase